MGHACGAETTGLLHVKLTRFISGSSRETQPELLRIVGHRYSEVAVFIDFGGRRNHEHYSLYSVKLPIAAPLLGLESS